MNLNIDTKADKRLAEIVRHKSRTIGFCWNKYSYKRINIIAKKLLKRGELEVIGGSGKNLILMRKEINYD